MQRNAMVLAQAVHALTQQFGQPHLRQQDADHILGIGKQHRKRQDQALAARRYPPDRTRPRAGLFHRRAQIGVAGRIEPVAHAGDIAASVVQQRHPGQPIQRALAAHIWLQVGFTALAVGNGRPHQRALAEKLELVADAVELIAQVGLQHPQRGDMRRLGVIPDIHELGQQTDTAQHAHQQRRQAEHRALDALRQPGRTPLRRKRARQPGQQALQRMRRVDHFRRQRIGISQSSAL